MYVRWLEGLNSHRKQKTCKHEYLPGKVQMRKKKKKRERELLLLRIINSGVPTVAQYSGNESN